MCRRCSSFIAFIALSLVQFLCSASIADAVENRVERNFTVADMPGPRVAPVPVTELRIAKGKIAVRIGSGNYELETLTVTPPGAGPFPLAVVSHGTPTRGGKSALRKLRNRQMLPIAEDFARRGYKAVIFARRGYASSSGSFQEGYGKCEDASKSSYVRIARKGAEDFAAIIEALSSQRNIDGSTVIAAGHSGGGFVVSALALDPPTGLTGIVNFAGGRGGQKNGNCSKNGFVHAFGEFGDGAKVPALWLYSSTDRMFRPKLVDRALDAYADDGAPVRLERVGALWFTDNGHLIHFLGARELWRSRIDAFLDAIGAPNWESAPNDAGVAKPPPPSGLGERGGRRWSLYLGYPGHKAFAHGSGRQFGWSALQDTVEEAVQAAMKDCEKRGGSCRVVSVDGAKTP